MNGVIQLQASLDFLSEVYRSKVSESFQQRPCLYDAERSSFPGLKEGQRDCITMVTAVTYSSADRTSRPTSQLRSGSASKTQSQPSPVKPTEKVPPGGLKKRVVTAGGPPPTKQQKLDFGAKPAFQVYQPTKESDDEEEMGEVESTSTDDDVTFSDLSEIL
ncbi:hypothetical protein CRENBAI_025664 [Crenichthys baileyi]|uniref:Uncharacterized protein n=1 Tax=Crenichthys baileyi TaxID=28760 RepID=A0AAV9SK93_9TELE